MHKKIVIFGLIATFLGGTGLFVYRKQNPTKGGDTVTVGGVDFTLPEGGKVELVEAVPAPEMKDPVFDAEVPTEMRAKVLKDFVVLRDKITSDPNNFNAWLDIAIYYKVAGDLRAAEKVWLYLTDTALEQSISTHNLGTLYHLTFKEYEKAEWYFEEAIRREPKQQINYLSYYELYRYSYKTDTNRAVEVLEQGLEAIPNNPDFLLSLGTYYRDVQKDNKKAAEYYLKARDAVARLGNLDLARRIEADVGALK